MQDSAYLETDQQRADPLRLPPQSIEAEQSVLGGLMLDNQVWDQVADVILSEDFYRRDHRLIFEAIIRLAEESSPYDVITLTEYLKKHGELEEAGGLPYLTALAKNTPSAANIKAYASIVRDRSILRQLIHIGTEVSDSAYNPEGQTTAEILDKAEQKVFHIAEQTMRGRAGLINIKKYLTTAVDRIDALFTQEGAVTGISTGYTDLDEKTSGLQKSDLIIVAGRPSMGKTSFAMNLVENAAIKDKAAVAVFSMEMPGEQLSIRLMSSLGRIDQHKMRTGQLDDEDWPRITSSVSMLSEAAIFIDDTPALSPNELRARCRRLAREHGELGLIVIDYLQLMQVPGMRDNRVGEISEISRSLKALAKELNVPVIALSQLNRSLEQRPNKRPVMSDLRESGAIEQDADIIIFIYRDEVYNKESEDKGSAEIIIGKQRNGPIGTVRLAFLGKYTRFENFAYDNYKDEIFE